MDRPTLLVVDDDDGVREITSLSLEMVAGWEVLQADSGYAALDLARRHKPDAVLLDVMMPGMDGPSAFARMQEDEELADIPVILLTAKVQYNDRARWADLAVAGVIAKPFDPMTLPKQVAELVGWKA